MQKNILDKYKRSDSYCSGAFYKFRVEIKLDFSIIRQGRL